MTSNRAKIIVLSVFVLTLGAGVVAGLLASRLPNNTPTTPVVESTDDSPLTQQLGLNPEQSRQMQKIWQGVQDLSVESLKAGVKAEHQRDDAIRALIPPEKIGQFNEVQRGYSESMAKLKGNRQAAFDKAVHASNAILTESQRKKYNEILKKRLGAEAAGGHDPISEPAGIPSASQPAP